MKLEPRRRWLLLCGLLAVTLAMAAWVNDRTSTEQELVAATAPDSAPAAPREKSTGEPTVPQVNLQQLQSRELGDAATDPFRVPRPPVRKRPSPAAPVRSVAPAPAPLQSAPPLPFTYLGKLAEGSDVAVFLNHGERNLIVRQGETIDSLYRVDQIAENAIILTYLPLNQQQTLPIGGPR